MVFRGQLLGQRQPSMSCVENKFSPFRVEFDYMYMIMFNAIHMGTLLFKTISIFKFMYKINNRPDRSACYVIATFDDKLK